MNDNTETTKYLIENGPQVWGFVEIVCDSPIGRPTESWNERKAPPVNPPVEPW